MNARWRERQDWWRERDQEVRQWPMSTGEKWRFVLTVVAVLTLQALEELDRSMARELGHLILFRTRILRGACAVIAVVFMIGVAGIAAVSSGSPSSGPVADGPLEFPPGYPMAVCHDSWISLSQHHPGTCSSHRGVRQWLQ
jgi:hypothetical protein